MQTTKGPHPNIIPTPHNYPLINHLFQIIINIMKFEIIKINENIITIGIPQIKQIQNMAGKLDVENNIKKLIDKYIKIIDTQNNIIIMIIIIVRL